ncbi:efflux RND transporter periplasmic adaptor subunit [Albimonas pacifica]|uniref:Membrane fusion protein, multidrug efflux system n=1 Tax=Albimonas pacifica TaxID=1114924 RepID=A0A1I3EKW9_9RHOB|nr:efflux RND transporter periplasmic adaptor subunit [Albimonas pacifica]SFH99645.1 membrane fusion protein, multidrug efflux system [Albimonas pacifica]
MASIAKQLLVLAVLAGGAGWFIHQQSEQPAAEQAQRARPAPGVVVAQATAGEVERVVSAVGTGRALRSVELRFAVGGRVTAIQFRDGDPVEAEEPLATLDDGSERAALAVAQAELAEAEAAFDRAAALQEQGRTTASVYDSAKAAMLRAEARLDAARTDLGHMILRAPFSGVIGFSELDEGAVVSTSTPVAMLEDISQLDLEFMVPERFFGDVEIGAPVRARTSIFPDETFEGVVEAIDRRVDEVSRSFLVRARFANPGLRLPAGVFMQVDLVMGSRPGVIAPEEALVTEAGDVHLYVVTPEDTVQRRAVTVGGRRAGEAEILEGLSAGERVVVRGVQKVRDGGPVRVLGEEPRTDAGESAPEARAAAPASAG